MEELFSEGQDEHNILFIKVSELQAEAQFCPLDLSSVRDMHLSPCLSLGEGIYLLFALS